MSSEKSRARYWARSFAGWHEYCDVAPNAAHHNLARLQRAGWLSHLMTQNVDRLHQKAGSRDVLELHGTTHECVPLSPLSPFPSPSPFLPLPPSPSLSHPPPPLFCVQHRCPACNVSFAPPVIIAVILVLVMIVMCTAVHLLLPYPFEIALHVHSYTSASPFTHSNSPCLLIGCALL